MLSPDKQHSQPSSSSSSAQPFTPAHASSSSYDFGAFTSAPPAQRCSPYPAPPALADTDLLGSFDDPQDTATSSLASSSRHPTPPRNVDLLGGDEWEDRSHQSYSRPLHHPDLFSAPTHEPPPAPTSSPIHVNLPPRPTDISPDYVPPIRSPRRLSTNYMAAGLSSPPLVTGAGSDIIFHPSHESGRDSAVGEMRRVQRTTSRTSTLSSLPPLTHDDSTDTAQQHSVSHSPPHKLLDTIVTTTRLASKWRSALNHSTFANPQQPSHEPQGRHASPGLAEPIPIEVTHDTPFASAEQIAGSYSAPAGAPGFNPRNVTVKARPVGEGDWGHISLVGRRDITDQVLKPSDADSLRLHLPPRQRLANTWTLLFSLDQHGASLSTLYRLVDKYAQSHRNSGNVLVVRDGQGNRFGVFMNEAIVKREGTYYGSGES
nr:uncharacterized protein CI109_002265 [Kwoniella shandongensis]KAA5529372.1 hypothetical protein CI109_002265 [Kwoniella shandongensis]